MTSLLEFSRHVHTAFLVVAQRGLNHHLRKPGVAPGDVAWHGEVHGWGVEQPYRHFGIHGLLVLLSQSILIVPAHHLQCREGSSLKCTSIIIDCH